jgi:hypothetical protein
MTELCGKKESNDSADSGTLIHDIAACLLTGRSLPPVYAPEQLRAAEWYAREVRRAMTVQGVETRLELPQIHPDCFGTCDAHGLSEDHKVTVIGDLKTGYIQIDAFENWQLISYSSGINIKTPWTKFMIFQTVPVPTIREWKVATLQLEKYYAILREAASEAMSSNPLMRTGPHCRYCEGMPCCEAGRRAALEGVELSLRHKELTPEELAVELHVLNKAADAIKFRLTSLTAQAMSHIAHGKQVPGWSISSTTGREKWVVPVKDVIEIGNTFGVDVSKVDVLTPNQAREAGLPAALVNMFSKRDQGSTTLKELNVDKMFN